MSVKYMELVKDPNATGRGRGRGRGAQTGKWAQVINGRVTAEFEAGEIAVVIPPGGDPQNGGRHGKE